jgi:hypothetical protein
MKKLTQFLAIALIVTGSVACDGNRSETQPADAGVATTPAPAENTATVTETSVTTTDMTATTSPAAPADAAAAPADPNAPATTTPATGTDNTTGTQQPQQ